MSNGVLIIDKPPGLTSFDVVRKVRTTTRVKKVGHTGTLDPQATGVLVLCLGKLTRLVPLLTDCSKVYKFNIKLGQETNTQDKEGKVVLEKPVPSLKKEEIEALIPQFTGALQQMPPMFSAKKHKGERLYQLARQGKEVERETREVMIHELKLLQFSPPDILEWEAKTSKGTYVRTLASDMAKALGTVGHLDSLERTVNGPFSLENALNLEALTFENFKEHLLSPDEILKKFPTVFLSDGGTQSLKHGRRIIPQEIEKVEEGNQSSFLVFRNAKENKVLGFAEKKGMNFLQYGKVRMLA